MLTMWTHIPWHNKGFEFVKRLEIHHVQLITDIGEFGLDLVKYFT